MTLWIEKAIQQNSFKLLFDRTNKKASNSNFFALTKVKFSFKQYYFKHCIILINNINKKKIKKICLLLKKV
jgi:accessory colonization factor AcfC